MLPVILYAEDDRDDRFLIWKVLESWPRKADLRFVRDGAEAIAYLTGADGFADRSLHPLPHLIILDIKMPKLDGFDVLGWIRSQPAFSPTPVLMMSSSPEPTDITKAYTLGANAYFIKPCTFDHLTGVISGACNFFLKNGQPK